MNEIENDRKGFGHEFATAWHLAKYMRTGRLVIALDVDHPPAPLLAGVKSSAAAKLAFSRIEVAEQLSVSIRTFDRWVAAGLIRASGVGRRKIFAITELERFLKETSEAIDI